MTNENFFGVYPLPSEFSCLSVCPSPVCVLLECIEQDSQQMAPSVGQLHTMQVKEDKSFWQWQSGPDRQGLVEGTVIDLFIF